MDENDAYFCLLEYFVLLSARSEPVEEASKTTQTKEMKDVIRETIQNKQQSNKGYLYWRKVSFNYMLSD